MKLYLCRTEEVPEALRPCFYTLSRMEALPIPTAMKTARALARDALSKGACR